LCDRPNQDRSWPTGEVYRSANQEGTCGAGVIAPRSRTVYMVVSMDSLTVFGLFAVTAMLVFYALEERNTFYIL
jgi:hypothetical protein